MSAGQWVIYVKLQYDFGVKEKKIMIKTIHNFDFDSLKVWILKLFLITARKCYQYQISEICASIIIMLSEYLRERYGKANYILCSDFTC